MAQGQSAPNRSPKSLVKNRFVRGLLRESVQGRAALDRPLPPLADAILSRVRLSQLS
jgi:hypothetical protein